MKDAEILYWDVLSDLAADNVGLWEIAWRANTIFPGDRSHATQMAATLIRRLIDEGLAVPHLEPGQTLTLAELDEILGTHGWADNTPTVLAELSATEAGVQHVQAMPDDAASELAKLKY